MCAIWTIKVRARGAIWISPGIDFPIKFSTQRTASWCALWRHMSIRECALCCCMVNSPIVHTHAALWLSRVIYCWASADTAARGDAQRERERLICCNYLTCSLMIHSHPSRPLPLVGDAWFDYCFLSLLLLWCTRRIRAHRNSIPM